MRIAYIALHLGEVYINSGVGIKIKTQLHLWQELGHEACLFLHTPDISTLSWQGADVSIFRYQQDIGILGRELSRSAALGDLIRKVKSYQPDIIYLRYGLYTYPLQALYDIAPVMVEINTDDLSEYRTRGTFYYEANRMTRKFILGPAAAFMPVSHEIAHLPENQIYRKPEIVISNGIDMRLYTTLPAPSNAVPVLAFVGSPGRSWHGVDKLLPLAAQFPELQIEVIGYRADEMEDSSPNLIFHGYLPPDGVAHVLARCDVAFGTLALHRKNMQEASSLKVREALAYGLPVILGYDDTDLMDADFNFILKLPNENHNVLDNGEKIRDFAYRMRGVRVERPLIAARIDQVAKESARVNFFQSILRP